MIHTRGNPRDFNDLNIPGWTWEDLEPYFLRYEGLQDLSKLPASSVPYHNTTGPIKMEFFADSENSWHPRIIEGFESLNFPFNADVNAASQIGVTQVIGYVYDNVRMGTARAYLSRDDVKKVLKVATFTKCTGVTIGEGNIARGITVSLKDNRTLRLYATKEVILSAGALETPKILMLSGIGHSEHLEKFNISTVADLPVGDNMTDHLIPLLFIKVDKVSGLVKNLAGALSKVTDLVEFLLLQSGPLTSNGLTDVSAFLNTECYDFEKRQLVNASSDCEVPNLQYIHAYVDRGLVLAGPFFQQGTGLNDAVTKQLQKISIDHPLLVFSPCLLYPFSQGAVRLASADPLAPPAIDPGFLTDERDVEELVRAITIVEHLMDTPAFKQQHASIIRLQLPGYY